MVNDLILKMDEPDELLFKIDVYGTMQKPHLVRLVCEIDNNKFYAFNGELVSGGIKIIVPVINDNLIVPQENYEGKLEIFIENYYFVPLKFNIVFTKKFSVSAGRINKNSKITISAAELNKNQ